MTTPNPARVIRLLREAARAIQRVATAADLDKVMLDIPFMRAIADAQVLMMVAGRQLQHGGLCSKSEVRRELDELERSVDAEFRLPLSAGDAIQGAMVDMEASKKRAAARKLAEIVGCSDETARQVIDESLPVVRTGQGEFTKDWPRTTEDAAGCAMGGDQP